MKLYDELAEWWPIFSAPSSYQKEARYFRRLLDSACATPPESLLELGSGGGNNARYLRAHYTMTLVDASPQMLAVSRALNPRCEHLEGDMRTVRLGRTFDAVFVHDAICYMTTEDDLRAAMRTAFEHLRAGGVALLVPDFVRETFAARTHHGGHDRDGRSLRYLEWTFDPNPADTTYLADYAIMLRDETGAVRVVHDRHLEGLFSRADWIRLMREVGFEPHRLVDDWKREIFLGTRIA